MYIVKIEDSIKNHDSHLTFLVHTVLIKHQFRRTAKHAETASRDSK